MKTILSLALCLVVLPTSITATGVSAEIFPSLRKKLQKEKLVALKTQTKVTSPEEKESQDAPLVVPEEVDAGEDGFPQLPAVSQMLSAASGTLKSVNTQATSLEARVVQAQMQSEAKMAKQKAAFEEKLKLQEQSNQDVIKANANITSENKVLKGGNNALKKHAHEVEETNKLMRSELRTLQSRLGVAKDFTSKSLTSTDDSKNAMLQVLKGGKKHHHAFVETASKTKRGDADEEDDEADDDDDESADDDKDQADSSDEKDGDDEDDDDEEGSTSFLALSSKVRRKSVADNLEVEMNDMDAVAPAGPVMPDAPAESPDNLLVVLSKEVAALAAQEKESEKTLKSLFIRDFRAGAKRHQALLSQQKSLNAKHSSLHILQNKLKTAVSHLEATRAQLEGRLHGLGQFLQKLAHFAMAPEAEAAHLLDVLPKAVVLKVV